MATKKTSLTSALREATGQKPIPEATPIEQPEIEKPNYLPPSRQGKRIVSGHFDPAVVRQLKQLALDHDTTIQALLTEALNDLMVKYGKPPIAS